jgi:hypothetical protein
MRAGVSSVRSINSEIASLIEIPAASWKSATISAALGLNVTVVR